MDEKAVVTWNMTASVDFDALRIAGLEARSAATHGDSGLRVGDGLHRLNCLQMATVQLEGLISDSTARASR